MKIPSEIRPLFHNYDPDTLDTERHAPLIIKTVMQGGTWEQVLWAARFYGRERFEAVLRADVEGNQTLPRPVANFWSVVLWGRPLPPQPPLERWRPTRRVQEG